MPSSFQREMQTDDNSIQSYNFGGLNTTASRLNVPYNDATELLNINVGIDGSLTKRNGSKLLESVAVTGGSVYGVAFRSVLGYNYTVQVRGNTLSMYSRDNDEFKELRTFTNVFTTILGAAKLPTQWVQLPDTYSRVLGLSADSPPTEVYIVEHTTGPYVSAVGTILLPSKFSGEHPTSGLFKDTLYVTINGVKTEYKSDVTTYTTNAVTKEVTVTLPVTPAIGATVSVDVIGFRWCWWAESTKWFGDRYFDTLNRFNVTANDNNVVVPSALRSDYLLGEESFFAILCKTFSIVDTYSSVAQPLTVDQYGCSEGSVYVPGTNSFLNTSTAFITFGLARTPFPQPAETVKMLRFRALRFKGTNAIRCGDLRVTLNEVVIAQNFTSTPTASSYAYQTFNKVGALSPNANDIASVLGFSGGTPIGIGPSDVVTVTNTVSTRFNGTIQREVGEGLFTSGSYRRIYGISGLCTYEGRNTLPSVGCVYQGRLALSGVNTDKSRITLSSAAIEEDRYSFYQITDDLEGLETDPFDIVVSGGDSADFIVGMVEWNNSLFTLTRRSVYRISGGNAPLTANRRLVTYISNIGLVNTRCLVRTDTAVYYMSDGGVFNLTPRVEDSEFNALEKSLKIRDLVLSRNTTRLVTSANMSFDSRQRRLYVSLPNSTDTGTNASDLLILDTIRDSWTSYKAPGNYQVQSMYESIDNTTGQYNTIVSTVSGTLLIDYSGRYTDFTTTHIGSTTYTRNIPVGNGVLAVEGTQRYDIPNSVTTTFLSDVPDVQVYVSPTLAGVPVPVAFTKYNNYIYLNIPSVAGEVVWFASRSIVNMSPAGRERYGTLPLYPFTLWKGATVVLPTSTVLSTNTTTLVMSITITFTKLVTDLFTLGVHYLANYTSSMFTQQALGTLKRTKHAYLYFRNGESSNYTVNANGIVEEYITRVNVNIAMLYDSDDNSANTSIDLYGYQDIMWDNAYFDQVESSLRQEEYSLFKEPLIGIGYSYRLNVFSYDDARWNMVGYQIAATGSKGLRYINQR